MVWWQWFSRWRTNLKIRPFTPFSAHYTPYFPLVMLDLNQLFVKNRIFRAFFLENIWWVRWKAVLLHPLSRDTPCGAHKISDLWRDLHTDRRSSTRSRCCSCDVIAGVSHQGTRSTVNDQVSFNLFIIRSVWTCILGYRQSDSASLCFRVEWSAGYFSIRDFTTESLILAQDER